MFLTKASTGYFNTNGFNNKNGSFSPENAVFPVVFQVDRCNKVTKLAQQERHLADWVCVSGKTVLQVQEWNTCFQEQFSVAEFVSLSFLRTAGIFLLIVQLKNRIALIYLSLTFYYKNWFYQKPFFLCSLSYQTAFLFLPSSAGNAWIVGDLVN